MKTGRLIIFGCLLLAVRLCGANAESNFVAKLEPVAPFATTKTAANAKGIPLEDFDTPAGDGALSPGDSVTALVTLHEKRNRLKQWLIYFQIADKPKQASKEQPRPIVIHTSTGNQFEFAGSHAFIRVRTLGPFVEPKSGHRIPAYEDQSAQASVNKDLLVHGINQGIAVIHRWNHFGDGKDGKDFLDSYQIGPNPYDSARVEHAKMLAARLNVTMNEERAVAGLPPALFSYFDTVGEIPHLEGILLKVLSKPSLWSLVRNLGVNPSINVGYRSASPVSLDRWDLPSSSTNYTLPIGITLNGHHALDVTLISAPARPPFLPCSGIVGFLAENPDDAENFLTLRVISAHCKTSPHEVAH